MADYSVDIQARLSGFEKLDQIEAKILSLQNNNKIKIQFDTSGLDKLNGLSNATKQMQNAGKQAVRAYQNGIKSQLNIEKLQESLKTGKYTATSSRMKSQLTMFKDQDSKNIQNATKAMKEYDSAVSNLSKHFDSNNSFKLDADGLKKNVDILRLSADTFQNSMSQVRDETTRTANSFDKMASANKIQKYWKENTKLSQTYIDSLKDLESRARTASTTGDLSAVNKEFRKLDSEISASGLKGKSKLDEVANGFKRIGQFAYTYGALQKGVQAITNSITELKEIDTVLTEISKTSNLTDIQIKELGKSSFDTASKFGRTAKDYLIGVQEMSRSGFYGKQAEDLAKLSVLAQSAGDVNRDIANSYLLATNAAYSYNGSVEKLNGVLDGQNMITNRNSVSLSDMSEATSKAASMASQTGVKVEELSAVIGTAVSRTKQGGEIIGTSVKSLFINLQDTSNKKIVGTFERLGLSQTKLVNGSEQLKTPIELLKELSKAYAALPDGSSLKADVLRNIGNKRQANVLAAILAGMDSGDYDKMLKDYSQGMGSAAVEAEKSANNWEGSLNKLSNAWTGFISNFANTDAIISGTKALTGLINIFDTLTQSPLLMAGTFGAGVGIFEFIKNLD